MKKSTKLCAVVFIIGIFLFGSINFVYAIVHVNGYFRKNGTYVAPYVRTDPDGIKSNNFSYTGNSGYSYTPPFYTSTNTGTWCGNGNWFWTKSSAQTSLDNAYTNARKDLQDEISRLQEIINSNSTSVNRAMGIKTENDSLRSKNEELQKQVESLDTQWGWMFWLFVTSAVGNIYLFSKKNKNL